jgi:hypothetical protein
MFNPQPKKGIPPKKEKKPLKRTALKKTFKATGEKDVFESVLDNISDLEETRCFVCGVRVAVVTHSNFGHVLSKGKYPKFKLNPANIVILCHRIIANENGNGCHNLYDHSPHSELKGEGWERLFELREKLKEEYKKITNL